MSNNEKDTRHTREKIIEAALRLFSEKSYKIVSLSMIAKEVDIQKSSIYHYFECKEDLFIEAVKSITDEFYYVLKSIAEKEIPARKKVEEIFRLHTKFIDPKKNILKIFNSSLPDKNVKVLKFFKEFKNKIDTQMRKIICEIIEQRNDKLKLNPDILVDLFFGMIKMLAHKKSFCPEEKDSEDEILRHINILLFNKE